MPNQKILIAKIDSSRRLRPVDPAHAEVIAASVAEVGLRQPITVRPHRESHEDGCEFQYELVIGGHRLYAVDLLLGWSELTVGRDVIIEDLDDDQALLVEVDENLARHELNALDRAIFLAERKRLYLKLNPEAGRGKAKKIKDEVKGQTLAFYSRSFARATSARVGLSRQAIDLSLGIAEKLNPEAVAALRGTDIETNQRELLALAALDPFSQRQVAGEIRQGKAKSVAKALVSLGLRAESPSMDPQARLYVTLLDAWTKANKVTRANFLADAGLVYAPAAPEKTPSKSREDRK